MGKQASKLKGYDNIFAVNLRKLMERNKTTQEALATGAGCSRQAISQYMDGSSVPNVDKLLNIADYFGVSIDYLLGREEKLNEKEWMNQICDLTGLTEQAILCFLNYPRITELMNFFLDNSDYEKKVLCFDDFCEILEVYRAALDDYIANYVSHAPFTRIDKINRVDLCEFRSEKAARKLVELYVEEQQDEIERLRKMSLDELRGLKRGTPHGDDQETQ